MKKSELEAENARLRRRIADLEREIAGRRIAQNDDVEFEHRVWELVRKPGIPAPIARYGIQRHDKYDVRTCVVTSEPCPVCGCTECVECSADFLGEEDYRHWSCGRREERWPGKDWQVTRECGETPA